MTPRVRWTKEEDKILVQAIKANPHNKAKAFKQVAKKVNHNEKSCSKRWYSYLSNPESKHYVGCLFTMVGHHAHYNNRTNYTKRSIISPTKQKPTIWTKIKQFLGLK